MSGPLQPSISLLVKLGVICERATESLRTQVWDVAGIRELFSDPEVATWMQEMDQLRRQLERGGL